MATPLVDGDDFPPPPDGFIRNSAPRAVMDIVHWISRRYPVKGQSGWPLGAPVIRQSMSGASRGSKANPKSVSRLAHEPPSVGAAVLELTATPV